MPKTALIIRHVPYEGVAGYRVPIEAAGYAVDRVDVSDRAFVTIDLSEPDLLVMMGGPMGVYETAEHPWIPLALAKLSYRLARGKPTLGVCFGSQMIAAALGGRVYAGPVREVGFAPVELSPAGLASPLRHIGETPVLHWHGDSFDLPPDVELLASTATYPHQAFHRGPNILALQFHAEMGEDPRFQAWLECGVDYITRAGHDIESLRTQHDRHGPEAVRVGRAMIGEWLAGLTG